MFVFYHLIESALIRVHDEIANFDIGRMTISNTIIFGCFCCAMIVVLYLVFQNLFLGCAHAANCLYNWRKLGLNDIYHGISHTIDKAKFNVALVYLIIILYKTLKNVARPAQPPMQNDVVMRRVRLNEFDELDEFDEFDEFDFDVFNFGGINHVGKRNDTQNVHDSGVNRYIIDAVKKLDNQVLRPFDDIHAEILAYLNSSTHECVADALDVLKMIKDTNMYHDGTHKTETEILSLVWQRIHEPVNAQCINDLKESLLTQLIDCKTDGMIMCGGGRIARILQTLECIDAEDIVNLRPMWAISETIGDYCGKYVDKLLTKVSPEYKEAIDALDRTPEQQKLAEKFYTCVKNNLQRRFKSMYLDTNILTVEQLNRFSKEYMDQLE